MAPTTEFEDTSGADWTSLANEQSFLQTIAAETDATLSQAGESVDGNPMWRVDLGSTSSPAGGTLLVTALSHGSELACREGVLSWLRDLAYSADMAVTDYLASHRLVIMPTCNPDGVAEGGVFLNQDGVDINRDVFVLESPEQRAMMSVIGALGDVTLRIDCHEGSTNVTPNDVRYSHAQWEAYYSGIDTMGLGAISALQSDLDGESITHATYEVPSRRSGAQIAGAFHSVGILLESLNTNPVLDRHAHYQVMLESLRAWHGDNDSALLTMQADSRTYQATTSDQYILEHGTTEDPWPQTALPADLVGYRLTGGLAPAAFGAYGVTVSGGSIVPLGQEARAVIPVLLDPESDDVEATALRLTVLPTPGPSATVQEFAEVVYGSHRMVAEAWVLSIFQTGDNPAGELIDILSGSVTFDATAEMFASLELETSGLDERRRSRFPRRAGDLLAPYGTEVFCRRGVDIGSEIMWSPLGYFRLNDDEQAPASDAPIRLSGQDRMAGIVDARLVIPRQFRRTRTFAHVVGNLVTDVYPGAVIAFDDDSGDEQIGRQLLVEEDRHAALLDLAESLGKVIFWDGEGVLRIEDAPDPDDLVWSIKAGHHGVLVDNARRVSREGMANAIVARGEGGDTLNPVQAIVVDDGPNSPTRWFPPDDPTELWFGQVPHFYSSPLLTTEGGAVKAGMSLLRRRIGLPYTVEVRSQVNPALRPRHAVRVVQKDGTRERHLMDTVTIPLVHGSPLTGTTREQTNVRISEVKPSALGGG